MSENVKLNPVSSSSISAIGYDKATKRLLVRFIRGAVYQYADVSEELYKELMSADSVGRFFAANIKNSYLYELINEE